MSTIFVGRQPIYGSDLRVVAYEVLFRASDADHACISDGDQATAELILNIFTEIGLGDIVGDVPAFINVTRNFILDGHAHALPHDRVVLEVLEDVEPEPEIIAALQKLSEDGYTIALDDFIYRPELEPLVRLADIVKVELPAISQSDLPRHVQVLREAGVRLLAEKVETYETLEYCQELGFDYFQGYFFCRPKVISGTSIPVNRLAALRLIHQLRRPDVCVRELANIISTEPSLCYKLLRFVNSASCALSRKVDSIQAAVSLAGTRRLQTFSSLALMAKLGETKPPELIVTALTRARMSELLAQITRRPQTDIFFVLGLFSVIDALLDKPMSEAIESLPLEPAINEALLHGSGPLAEILQCVTDYDQGNFDRVDLPGVEGGEIRSAYLEAVAWAAESVTAAKQLA